MKPIKKPKPLRGLNGFLYSFNADILFGLVTELVQRYYNFWNLHHFFNTRLYSPRNSKTLKRIIFDFWGNEDKSIQ